MATKQEAPAQAHDAEVVETKEHPAPAPADIPPAPAAQGAMITMIEKVALNPDIPIDKLERLLTMQERIMDREAAQAFAVAMSTCQADMPQIEKDAKNTQTKSMYARLERINHAITPIYTRHGFSLTFNTGKSDIDGCIKIMCDVIHTSGHIRHYSYDSPIDDKGIQGSVNKTPAHARASAISYGRRYLTLMVFNLTVGGEDDDGNGATPPPVEEKKISEPQAEKLKKMLTDYSIPTKDFLAEYKGIEKIEDLPAAFLANAIKAIKNWENVRHAKQH